MGVSYLWLVICLITAPVIGFVIAWVYLQSRLNSAKQQADSDLQALQDVISEKGREIDALKEEIGRLQAAAPPDCGPDDLTRIEGIGPKTYQILRDHGIVTFKDLAGSSVDHLKEIMARAAHGKLAHPDTWPEQAALAADLKWAELKVLQDHLKGGRRV